MTWTDDLADRFCIPPKHRDATLDALPNKPYRRTVCNYLRNLRRNLHDGVGLYLYGDYGFGKSALGCIILKFVSQVGRTGLFLKCKRLPDLIINEILFDEDVTWYRRMRDVDVLVIDEVLVCGDRRDRYLEDLVRDRSDSGLTTIVTTNESPKALGEKFRSFANVIQECMVSVLVDGKNFRAEKKEELRVRVKGK